VAAQRPLDEWSEGCTRAGGESEGGIDEPPGV